MNERTMGASPITLARSAGALYLINIVLGGFAIGYVQSQTVVAGDAAATAHAIVTHETLFRMGIVAHLMTIATNVPLAVIFWDLFKVVSRRAALLVVFFTLVGTSVEAANILNQFMPLALLSGGRFASAFTVAQSQALAYASLASQVASYSIQQVIYSGYLLAAGYAVYRSSFLPRALGALLALGAVCYLFYSFAAILAPDFADMLVPYIQIPSGLAEISLCLWLLIAGVNAARWKEQASAAGMSLAD